MSALSRNVAPYASLLQNNPKQKKNENTQAAAQTCLKLFLFDRIVNCHKKRGGSIERLRIVPLVWMAQRV
jgi:hypothetical protein